MPAVDIDLNEYNEQMAAEAKRIEAEARKQGATDEDIDQLGLNLGEAPIVEGPITDKPRDDKGRFIKQEVDTPDEVTKVITKEADEFGKEKEEKTKEAKPVESEEVVYRKEMVINGRKMVFDGASPEEVLDKVSIAIEASQPVKLEGKAEEKKSEATLSADELYALGTRLQKGELEAVGEYIVKNPKLIEQVIGVPVAAIKEMFAERQTATQSNRWAQATTEFTEAHPDYVRTDKNRELIGSYMAANQLPASPESIEKAYSHLIKLGALDLKQEEKPKVEEKPKAKGSSIFGTGQTGAERKVKPMQRSMEGDIARAERELGADDFIQYMNTAEVQEFLNSKRD